MSKIDDSLESFIELNDWDETPDPSKNADCSSFDDEDLELDLRDPQTFPLALTAMWMNTALCALDGTIVSTTMNEIASTFQQASMVTWVATAYMLTTSSVQPLYGKTSDILGRRKCLLFAEFMFMLGLVLCGLARSIPELAFARAICGIGGSGLGAMCNIILSDLAPLSQRSVYMGWGSVIWGTAQSIGGPLGGLLLNWFGIHGLFVVQIPFCIISMWLTWKYIHDIEDQKDGSWQDIDFGGSFFLMCGISAFIFLCSTNDVSSSEEFSPTKKVCLLLTIMSVIGFVLVEKYGARQSILPMYVLKGTLGLIGFIYGLASMLSYVGLFIIPLYLQLVWGVSITGSGGYIIFTVLSTSAGSFLCGWILRKFGSPSRENTLYNSGMMIVINTIISVIGFSIMFKCITSIPPSIGNENEVPWAQKFKFVLGFIIMGMSLGFQGVAVMLYNVAKVGKKGQAASTSVTFLFRSLGNVLSVSIALGIFVNSLKSDLRAHFDGNNNELYVQLLKDNTSVRTASLSANEKGTILNIFKSALVSSFYPSIICCILSVLSAFLLCIFLRKSRRT
ncbi:LAFE_0C05886g1_1 [Lachancea fermentati]|uniref:LAFE_0C05886g1_1 n=1 Tax=Lachancea fermentati TaxID=4955 RepID=A0A1G4M9X8_LACFM|nr:LAFE_0C05886g1_1 [Lachancea fermentati]